MALPTAIQSLDEKGKQALLDYLEILGLVHGLHKGQGRELELYNDLRTALRQKEPSNVELHNEIRNALGQRTSNVRELP